MKKNILLVLTLAVGLWAGNGVYAGYDSLARASEMLIKRGDYRSAEPILYTLRNMALASGDKPAYTVRVSISLAECYRQLGKLAQAEALVQETLKLAQQQVGGDNEDVGLLLLEQADIAMAHGRFAEAERLLTTVNGMKSIQQKESSLISVLNSKSKLYASWGKFDQANKVIDQVTAILSTPEKQKTMDYAFAVFMRGSLLELKGKYEEAIPLHSRATEIALSIYGKTTPYAQLLSSSASAFRAASRFSAAENILNEALTILDETFSGAHPDIARINISLADLYCAQGKYAQAEILARKAIEVQTKFLGPDSPDVAGSKSVLARICRSQGKYADAEAYCKQSLEQLKRLGGPRYFVLASPLNELGQIYADQGKKAESEATLKEARSIVLENLGTEHPDYADVIHTLAHLYLDSKRLNEAEPLFKQSLQLTLKLVGRGVTAATNYHDLADLYLKTGKLGEAETNANEALLIDEKIFGAKSAKAASDLELLSKILKAANKTAAANQATARFSAIEKELPGGRYLSTLKAGEAILAKPSPTNRPIADKWALVVGISNFKDPTIDLKYAAKDATDFRNFLVDTEHFQPDHVLLLTDAAATREQIVSKLGDGWLGKRAKPDDLVLIYVSSHGSPSREEVGVNFLVAHDTTEKSLLATGIPLQWLTKIVKEEVHSDRTVLILDVCHGAAAADEGKADAKTQNTSSGSAPGGKGIVYRQQQRPAGLNADSLPLGAGQIVLASSLADQNSWESRNYANSVFTKRLMEALRVKGDQTTLQDAYLQLKSLVQSEVLRDRGELQTPMLSAKNWTGGDPVLSAIPVSPRPARASETE